MNMDKILMIFPCNNLRNQLILLLIIYLKHLQFIQVKISLIYHIYR